MIKKLLSVVLVAATITANAQQIKNAPIANPYNTANTFRWNGGNQVQNIIDTLMPSIMTNTCAASLVYYSIDVVAPADSGYYFGTGFFPFAGTTTTEIAQKYPSGTAGLSVTNVLTLAAKAKGTTATTTAKIYSENVTTKAPNAVLGTSTPKTMATYTTSGYNNYVFGTPVAVGTNVNFFAVITIPPFGGTDLDTMAIISTTLGCSTVDSLSWMLVSPYGWFNVKYLFGVNLELMIFPVVNIPTTGIAYSKGDLNVFAASPNPASNAININFSLNNSSKVEIEVIDITGQIVKTIKENDAFSNGKHSVSIDLTNLESGSYFYSISANGAKLVSKFVVTK